MFNIPRTALSRYILNVIKSRTLGKILDIIPMHQKRLRLWYKSYSVFTEYTKPSNRVKLEFIL